MEKRPTSLEVFFSFNTSYSVVSVTFRIFAAEISKNHDKKDDYLLPAILIECRSTRTRNY